MKDAQWTALSSQYLSLSWLIELTNILHYCISQLKNTIGDGGSTALLLLTLLTLLTLLALLTLLTLLKVLTLLTLLT